MNQFNLVVIYNKSADKILTCLRGAPPFMGLYNFVGGKIDDGEDHLAAAYRELYEETNISGQDVVLTHLMDFVYEFPVCRVEVYFGRLLNDVEVAGDENALYWLDAGDDFFDSNRFAGNGNCGHIVKEIERNCSFLFEDTAQATA